MFRELWDMAEQTAENQKKKKKKANRSCTSKNGLIRNNSIFWLHVKNNVSMNSSTAVLIVEEEVQEDTWVEVFPWPRPVRPPWPGIDNATASH